MSANGDPGVTVPLKRTVQSGAGAANPNPPAPYVFGAEIARGGVGSVLTQAISHPPQFHRDSRMNRLGTGGLQSTPHPRLPTRADLLTSVP